MTWLAMILWVLLLELANEDDLYNVLIRHRSVTASSLVRRMADTSTSS